MEFELNKNKQNIRLVVSERHHIDVMSDMADTQTDDDRGALSVQLKQNDSNVH